MAGDRDELTASTELIEQLLGDRALRASFRADPESVLREHGLAELADDVSASDGSDGPERAMLTLELRESRSSLAGVIVAAAAEGVDFTHVAEHAAPRLGREAGRAISHLVKRLGTHHHRPVAKPAAPVRPPARPAAPPQLQQVGDLPQMAHPAPVHHHVAPAAPAAPAPAHPAHEATTTPAHEAVVASASAGHVDLLQYPGDGASSQQIAAWMGANAQRAGLPPELPVMASLTESGLRNLDYGDRDSVGFFQMRTGIWDQGAYAGFPGDPQLQIKWFIEEALSVRRADPAIAASPSTWGEWVANVERPAFEYRGRYQLQLQPAQELLRATPLRSVAAASAAGGVGSAGIDVAAGAAGAAHRESLGHAVKAAASACVGVRCRAGGASAAGGFDGPGLVRYAYGREGVELPTSAAAQFEVGAVVPRADLRPGDAVFFGHSRGAIQDVGIYVGDGRVITASTQREAVSIDSLDASAMHFLGARRYSERLLTDAASYARTLPTVK